MNLLLSLARKALKVRASLLLVLTVVHFLVFYAALLLTEAPGAPILDPVNYWYYWWTTTLTIGYGDLSPQTAGGRAITPIFEFIGILLLAAWLNKVGTAFGIYESKKRRGLMSTDATDHILVIGDYDPVETRNLLVNAINDAKDDGKIPTVVGCFRNTGDANPFDRNGEYAPAKPLYVQAPPTGFSRKVLEYAGVKEARHIYVAASDDTVGIGIICLLSQLHVKARVALILREEESAHSVPRSGLELAVVYPVTAALAVREVEDPGTGAAVQELLSAGVGHSLYSLAVKRERTYADAYAAFTLLFGAGNGTILFGFSRKDEQGEWKSYLAPDWNTALRVDDRLVYIAQADIQKEQEAQFNALPAAA